MWCVRKPLVTWRKHGGPGKRETAILRRVTREEHSKMSFRDPAAVEEKAMWFHRRRVFQQKVSPCPEPGASLTGWRGGGSWPGCSGVSEESERRHGQTGGAPNHEGPQGRNEKSIFT